MCNLYQSYRSLFWHHVDGKNNEHNKTWKQLDENRKWNKQINVKPNYNTFLKNTVIYDYSFNIFTRRVPLVVQKLLTLPEHLRSSPDFGGVHVARHLIFCVVFCRSLCVLLVMYFLSLTNKLLVTPIVSLNLS